MTLREISTQLLSLTTDRAVDGTVYTISGLRQYFSKNLIDNDRFLVTVNLPDGTWKCLISRFRPNDPNGYDYTLPETRTEEACIVSLAEAL